GVVLLPWPRLRLDRFRDRQAFHHRPLDAGGGAVGQMAYFLLPLFDFGGAPHHAVRDMVEGGDDPPRSRLPRIRDRNLVHRTEPSPDVSHRSTSKIEHSWVMAFIRRPGWEAR